MTDADAFEADLGALGFRFVQEGRGGIRQYAAKASAYLTWWVHWNTADGSVLFTWEHSIGEYLNAQELQVGSNEPLNQYLFPKYDARGGQDITFVVNEIDRAEHVLRAVDLLAGQ